eukprot:gene11942-biopygen373
MELPWEGRDGAALGRAGRCCPGKGGTGRKGGTVLPWEGRDGAALGVLVCCRNHCRNHSRPCPRERRVCAAPPARTPARPPHGSRVSPGGWSSALASRPAACPHPPAPRCALAHGCDRLPVISPVIITGVYEETFKSSAVTCLQKVGGQAYKNSSGAFAGGKCQQTSFSAGGWPELNDKTLRRSCSNHFQVVTVQLLLRRTLIQPAATHARLQIFLSTGMCLPLRLVVFPLCVMMVIMTHNMVIIMTPPPIFMGVACNMHSGVNHV